jgi:NAD(P)-dependent dehydrogenase (short-subunit alcohol dehydrogenase family)
VALDRFGSVDILVNNAQSMTGGQRSNVRVGIEEFPEEWFDDAIRSGLYGTWYCSRAVLPGMKDRGYGKIINFGSSNGVFGQPGTIGYNCAKEAIRAFTKTAAREWGPYGVRVNVICPALRTDAMADSQARYPEAAAAMGMPPVGYWGDPARDGGALATYLASPDGDYVSGNTLFLAGGWHFLP